MAGAIQQRIGRLTDDATNRAAARAWSVDATSLSSRSLSVLIYVVCLTYWVSVVALCVALFSVWWWTPQLFTRLALTAIGVVVAYTSTPSRKRDDLEIFWTDDRTVCSLIDTSAEHFGVRRPERIGFTPTWTATSQPKGTVRGGSVVFGAALWQALSAAGRFALIAQLMAPARVSKQKHHTLVRITTESLREWAAFCNYRAAGDLLSFSSTGRGRYSSTTAQGLTIVGGWFADALLGVIGLVPALLYSALSVALVRLSLQVERASDEFAIEMAGRSAVIQMLRTTLAYDYFAMAMQRAVLGMAASPLRSLADAAANFNVDEHALDGLAPGDADRLAFVAQQPSGGSFSYVASQADINVPSEIAARIDRDIADNLKYQYSVTKRTRFGN